MRNYVTRSLALVQVIVAVSVGFIHPLAPVSTAHAQAVAPDLVSFYPTAYARTRSPPKPDELSILCQTTLRAKSGDVFISFVSADKKKVLIGAFSKSELQHPETAIFFEPQLKGGQTAKEQVEWLFIFDRAGRGRVDYLVWPLGPGAIKPPDFPADFPKGTKMTRQQYEYWVRNVRIVYQHWADDDFDGTLDAVVLEAADPDRPWIEGWQVIRSLRSDGVLDDCWFFKDSIGEKKGECERSGQGYKTRSLAPKPAFGPENFTGFSQFLSWLNAAAGKCGLTKDSF